MNLKGTPSDGGGLHVPSCDVEVCSVGGRGLKVWRFNWVYVPRRNFDYGRPLPVLGPAKGCAMCSKPTASSQLVHHATNRRKSNVREQAGNLTKPWNQCFRDTVRPSAIEFHPYVLPAVAGMAQAESQASFCAEFMTWSTTSWRNFRGSECAPPCQDREMPAGSLQSQHYFCRGLKVLQQLLRVVVGVDIILSHAPKRKSSL